MRPAAVGPWPSGRKSLTQLDVVTDAVPAMTPRLPLTIAQVADARVLEQGGENHEETGHQVDVYALKGRQTGHQVNV